MTVQLRSTFLRLLLFLLLSFIGALLYSCRKDFTTHEASNSQTEKARAWYESTFLVNNKVNYGLHAQETGQNHDLTQWIKPDWKHSVNYVRNGQEVIETPVDPDSKFASSIKLDAKRFNPKYSKSYYLIIRDSTTYNAYILTIVADSSYLGNDTTKLAHNTYRKHDADFTGSVLYFTPKGKYLGGYGYQKGKLTAPGTNITKSGKQQIQDIKSDEVSVNNMKEECTDWYIVYYINGEYWYDEYLTTTCRMVDDGQTPGGSGNPPPSPPPCPAGSHPGPPVIRPCLPPAVESVGGVNRVVVNYIPPPPPPGDDGLPPPPSQSCSVNPPREPCPIDTSKIVKNFCDNLTSVQKKTIISTIREFQNYNCLTKYLYNSISQGTSGYAFCISSGTGSATYNPTTKSVNFTTDYSSTRSDILGHELFHGYQDMVYPGGTAAYGKNAITGVTSPGFSNIEFEQAVYNDMLYNTTTAFQRGTAEQRQAYSNWLNTLTNNFTSYPKFTAGTPQYTSFLNQYNTYLSLFSNNSDNPYAGAIITLTPTALINLLSKSNCQ